MSQTQAVDAVDPFKPATKKKARGRFGIYGVSSSGKTETALLIANGLKPGGRIALLDTEAGSASKYADRYSFYAATLKAPFDPARLASVVTAAAANYDVLIVDGISPFWDGPGGVMAIVDASRQRGPAGGWKDGTPAQQTLVQAIINCPCHIIVTMRAKSDTVIEQVDGRQQLRKLGLKPIQRDGIDYELDLVGFMDLDHSILIEKSRAADPRATWDTPNGTRIEPGDIALGMEAQPAYQLGQRLAAWLEDGVAPPAAIDVPPVPPTSAAGTSSTSPSTPSLPPPNAAPQPATASAPASAPSSAPSSIPPPAPTTTTAEPPAAPISVPPAPTPPPAPAAPQAPVQAAPAGPGAITPDQATKLGELQTALKGLRPDVDWPTLLAEKAAEWFNVAEVALLNEEQAAGFIERVEGTLLSLRERAAGAA